MLSTDKSSAGVLSHSRICASFLSTGSASFIRIPGEELSYVADPCGSISA